MRMEKIEALKEMIKNFHEEIFRKTHLIEENNRRATLNFYEASIDQSVMSPFKMVHRLRRRLIMPKDV